MRPAREITSEDENHRFIDMMTGGPVTDATRATTSRRDGVEPEPVGTLVVKMFRVTGYDPDCDGSLMARLDNIGVDGQSTGWEADCLGLYPDSTWVIEDEQELQRFSDRVDAISLLDEIDRISAVGRENRPESQKGEFADGWDKGWDDAIAIIRDILRMRA